MLEGTNTFIFLAKKKKRLIAIYFFQLSVLLRNFFPFAGIIFYSIMATPKMEVSPLMMLMLTWFLH